MENNFNFSKKATQDIVDFLEINHLAQVGIKNDKPAFNFTQTEAFTLQDLHTSIHPYVANAMYEREKQVRNQMGMAVLYRLAKQLSPDAFEDLLEEALGFKLDNVSCDPYSFNGNY